MIQIMLNWFRALIGVRFGRVLPRRAATMLEYVLLAGVVLALGAVIYTVFGSSISGFFNDASDTVDNPGTVAP